MLRTSTVFAKAQVPGASIPLLLNFYQQEMEYQRVHSITVSEDALYFRNRTWAIGRTRFGNQYFCFSSGKIRIQETGEEYTVSLEGSLSRIFVLGGTLAGISTYLKEQNPKIEIVCADPYGAAMWSWFTNGNLETNDGDSIAEGIGQGRVTKNIEGIKVDRAYRVRDQSGLTIVYQLLREEGLFLGLSSGINVAGALRFAEQSGPGQTIVTVLCDSGHKYQSTLFNRDWLASNHLDPDLPLESILGR